MVKKGLPNNIGMRHDAHYVEELARSNRSIGRIIPISQIEPNPEQPRVEIGDLTEMSASIKEKGILEPLLVKPNRHGGTWMIIAGERRWRAANLAGLREVPCIELDIDNKAVAEIALIENLQRKDLTLWEEADGLKSLVERFGYKHDEIARKISKSRTTVTELLTIASLPEDIREKSLQAKINSKSVLLEIARQFDERAMHKFLEDIQDNNLNHEKIRRDLRLNPKEKKSVGIKVSGGKSQLPDKNIFRFTAENQEYYLELRFMNPIAADKSQIISALEKTLKTLKSADNIT